MKKALITGITGQDGSYLAELLLEKGYEVHGLVRRTSSFNRGRIEHLLQGKGRSERLFTHYGDMTDGSSLIRVLAEVQPSEIYNLAAQSHVQISFMEPEYTSESDALGVLRLLEAVKSLNMQKTCRLYQASTSELYGETSGSIQDDDTPFNPVSPYAAAKLYAYHMCECYKKAYGIHVCNGILFNHESPRRSENFVSRKITLSLAEILSGKRERMILGNLDAKRDWGFAGDYVEAMWLMLQQAKPDNFIIATGECHSVRDFVELAFKHCDIQVGWKGKGVEEVGVDVGTGRVVVSVSSSYYRPVEVPYLRGDPSRAMKDLGWKPKMSFEGLVKNMVEHDLKLYGVRPKPLGK